MRLELLEHRLDRHDVVPDAQRLGQALRVVEAALRRVLRRHGDTPDVLWAKRIDGDRRCHRRVDPAAQPDDRRREAALVQIIAHAERERPVNFLVVVGGVARLRLDGLRVNEQQILGEHRAVSPEHAVAVVVLAAAVEHQLVVPADEVAVHHRTATLDREL